MPSVLTLQGFQIIHFGAVLYRQQYTRNAGNERTPAESEDKEEFQFAKGNRRSFDPSEAVICWQRIGGSTAGSNLRHSERDRNEVLHRDCIQHDDPISFRHSH